MKSKKKKRYPSRSMYGRDYKVKELLRALESPEARARGIESPENTTFRTLKKVTSPHFEDREDRQRYAREDARALMGRPYRDDATAMAANSQMSPLMSLYNALTYFMGQRDLDKPYKYDGRDGSISQ